MPVLSIYATGRRLNTFRTMRAGAGRHGYRLRLLGYERAVRRRHLPAGAAIFTDFERMAPPWLEIAATLHARAAASGAPALNDPCRFLPRAMLLRKLHAEGVNRFTCWLPALGEWPDRFPVFLRTLAAHRGVIGGLIESAGAARAALEAALAAGHVLSDLGFIEYAGLVREGGVFRKRSAYAVAGEVVPALTVSDPHWVAKSGVSGSASAEQYAADHEEFLENPHAPLIRRVMELSGMAFGRVDFALTEQGTAVFELNTNPYIRFGTGHPDPMRVKTGLEMEARLHEALRDLARRGAGPPAPSLSGAFGWRGRLGLTPKMP